MPISGKEMVKLFLKHGYTLVNSGGKGSHTKLRKGTRTVIVPGHKELKKGLEISLRKVLEEEKR